jgi:hypothetical protein
MKKDVAGSWENDWAYSVTIHIVTA